MRAAASSVIGCSSWRSALAEIAATGARTLAPRRRHGTYERQPFPLFAVSMLGICGGQSTHRMDRTKKMHLDLRLWGPEGVEAATSPVRGVPKDFGTPRTGEVAASTPSGPQRRRSRCIFLVRSIRCVDCPPQIPNIETANRGKGCRSYVPCRLRGARVLSPVAAISARAERQELQPITDEAAARISRA